MAQLMDVERIPKGRPEIQNALSVSLVPLDVKMNGDPPYVTAAETDRVSMLSPNQDVNKAG